MRSFLFYLLLLAFTNLAPTAIAATGEAGGQSLADYLDKLNDLGQTAVAYATGDVGDLFEFGL